MKVSKGGDFMKPLRIYHGSKFIIEKPEKNKGKVYNDYGQGFYTTEYKELAKEWAVSANSDGFVNEYLLTKNGLKILYLNETYTILNWLAILLDNRAINQNEIAVASREYILKNYLIDYKEYDVIIGYRADDAYFTFVNEFITNQTSIDTLNDAMYLGKLGLQVFLQSEKAFKQLEYIDSEAVEKDIYYQKFIDRETKAKESYRSKKMKQVFEGLFIRDIINGGGTHESDIPNIKIRKHQK